MVCRTFLLKLEVRGYLTLPERRRIGGSSIKASIPIVPHKTTVYSVLTVIALVLIVAGFRGYNKRDIKG